MHLISCKRVSKRFGSAVAVSELDLDVSAGQVYGFLGPNGAGKTTTIRMLLGLIAPTEGQIRLLGRQASQSWSSVAKPQEHKRTMADLALRFPGGAFAGQVEERRAQDETGDLGARGGADADDRDHQHDRDDARGDEDVRPRADGTGAEHGQD